MHRFRMGDLRILYEIDNAPKICGSRRSNGEDWHTNNRFIRLMHTEVNKFKSLKMVRDYYSGK